MVLISLLYTDTELDKANSLYRYFKLFNIISKVLDLPQVDCENAKGSDSQDDESEGRSRESTCSACGIFNLICILLAPKNLVVT